MTPRTGLVAIASLLVTLAVGACGQAPSTGAAPATRFPTVMATDDPAGVGTAAATATPANTAPTRPDIPTNPPSRTLPAGTPSGRPPAGTPTRPAAPTARVVSPRPVTPAPPTASVAPNLRLGSEGAEVVQLQQRLNRLGFWVGPEDGNFAEQTRQGVLAAQKAAGIPTDGSVGRVTAAALAKGITLRPRTTSGRALEIDKARQLVLVVDNGVVVRYYNASTGGNYVYWNPGTARYETAETPSGTFTVTRQVEDWDPGYLGAIYRPRYFNGGIAIHGTNHDVTDVPESHGCVRLALASMDELIRADQIDLGTKVVVY